MNGARSRSRGHSPGNVARARRRLAFLPVIGIFLAPAAGPALLWSLVALGMRYCAVAGLALVATALAAEFIAAQWKPRIESPLSVDGTPKFDWPTNELAGRGDLEERRTEREVAHPPIGTARPISPTVQPAARRKPR
jgi:hypothetical protein